MFGWLKKTFGKAPAPQAPALEEGDKTFDAANFALLWISAIRVRGFESGDGGQDAFRLWLLSYSMAAVLARLLSGVEEVPVATSVASAVFPGGTAEVADGVVRMGDNWRRLGAAHGDAVAAYAAAVAGMFRHEMAGAMIQLQSQAKSGEEFAAIARMVPGEMTDPVIAAFDALVSEADAARFAWIEPRDPAGDALAGRPDPAGRARSVRVFVSSTFQDMHAERERLVKQVFPALRERCAARGVTLAEVDLRWGITAEDAQGGKVLDLCLREIEACRPYFVALLGDRYGWVPEQADPALGTRFPGLPDVQGLSATEVEIRYGLLADAERRERAALYLRATTLPPHERDPRQEALRGAVKSAGARVCAEYGSLDELAAQVGRDLARMIDEDFPDDGPADEFDAALQRQRACLLLSRPAPAFDPAILRAMEAASRSRLVVTGASGAGKTTLVCHWLRQRPRPARQQVILCIVGVTVPADLGALLRFLCAALALPVRAPVPVGLDALRMLLRERLSATDRELLLVLDGLDRLPEREGAAALTWLPDELPPHVGLVTTAAPGRAAEALAARGWPQMAAPPIGETERGRLATAYFAAYGKKPGAAQLERLARADALAVPLFAVTMLEELRVFGRFEGLDAEVERLCALGAPEALFGEVLARLERDFEAGWPGLVGRVLAPLALAREGLAEEDLRAIAGDPAPLPMLHWSPLRFALRQHLVELDGALAIACVPLSSAIRSRYLDRPDAVRRTRERIVAVLGAERDRRAIAEVLWQMAEGPLPEALLQMLRAPERLEVVASAAWPELVRAAASVHATDPDALSRFADDDASDWGVAPLALAARLLQEANADERDCERQVLQADEMRHPGTLDALAMLRRYLGHPDADLVRGDIAAGRVGYWSRMHLRMVADGADGLRLERVGPGLRARLWRGAPDAATPAVVCDLVYSGEGAARTWLRRAVGDPRYSAAQKLLNLAGLEVGHGVLVGAVPRPLPAASQDAQATAKAVSLYDAAREIYVPLDALDQLAFIGMRKASLPLVSADWSTLVAQSRRDFARALELDRPDAAAKFAFLRGQGALRLASRDEVAAAFRSLRDVIGYFGRLHDRRGEAMCAALLEELRTALRRLPRTEPPSAPRSWFERLFGR